MTPSRSLPLVVLALALVIVVSNARVLVGGRTWDDVRYHTEIAPPRLAAAAAVHAGTIPAWWDGTGLGVPLLAEPSHGAAYPPLWLAATPRGLDLVLLLHLIWAAVGVAVAARRRTPPATTGVSDLGALGAAVLIAMSGILASATVRGALPALAHLPWVLVAAGSLARASELRGRARATVALGLLVGAVALTGVFGVLVDAVVLATVVGARRRTAAWLIGGLVAGLAIGAIQWLPALLQLGHGAGASVGPLPLARLVELIVPGSFGATDPARAIGAIAGTAPWAPSLFVGAPLLALASVRQPSRRVLAALGVFAALALIVGRGGWPAWAGAPELHVAALALVLAIQAGAGVDALATGQRRAVHALVVAAACTAVVLGAMVMLRGKHPEAEPAIDRALLDGGLGLVCLLVAVGLAWRAPGRALPIVLALLVLPSAGARSSVAPVIDRAIVTTPPAWAVAVEALQRPARVYRPAFMEDAPPQLDDAIATFAGASAWRWRIAAARSEDPARSRDHDQTWLAASREGGALLDRFGIVLAILPDTLVIPRKLTALGRRGAWALVALPVAPVASVMHSWRWAVATPDALDLLFAAGGGTNVLRGMVVLRGTGRSAASRIRPPQPCTVEAWAGADIRLRCTSEGDGYAVVSSASSPGWAVTVDGRPSEVVTADVIRRATAISAGPHHVVWRYTAPGLIAGLGLAATALLGLGLMLRRAGQPIVVDDPRSSGPQI